MEDPYVRLRGTASASPVLNKAERRASGMKSIQADLDMGNGMTLDAFWQAVDRVREREKQYNTILSTVDQTYNDLLMEEKSLAELSEKMLSAVAVKFGRNSTEYEMAGGVRRAERRRSPRQVAEAMPE